MKERVVFDPNVPVVVTLAYPDGKKVQGRFGDQVLYSLADGRVMYVPPFVRDKLIQLGIRKDEPFSICRTAHHDGKRRVIDWTVQRNGALPPQPAVVFSASVHPARAANEANGLSSTHSGGNQVPKDNGEPLGKSTVTTGARVALESALRASIDAALGAQHYAATHGLSIRFGSEDLRAMALSLFIQHAREAGVR